jgi:hypothetical protein
MDFVRRSHYMDHHCRNGHHHVSVESVLHLVVGTSAPPSLSTAMPGLCTASSLLRIDPPRPTSVRHNGTALSPNACTPHCGNSCCTSSLAYQKRGTDYWGGARGSLDIADSAMTTEFE